MPSILSLTCPRLLLSLTAMAVIFLPMSRVLANPAGAAQPQDADQTRATRAIETPATNVRPRHWQSQIVRLSRPVLVPQLPLPGEAVARFSIDERTGDFRIRLLVKDLELPFIADVRSSAYGLEDTVIAPLSTTPGPAEVPLSPMLGVDRKEGRLTTHELAAYRDSRLVVHIEFLRPPTLSMRARLIPPPSYRNQSHNP